MNERAITGFLVNQITKERVESLARAANLAMPGSGIGVQILGALVIRAVSAAADYINRIDLLPVVPPDLSAPLLYEKALRYLRANGASEAFADMIARAANQSNPDINQDRILLGRAAAVVMKCVEHDDPLFNAVYGPRIEQGRYRKIWDTYDSFLQYRGLVRDCLPPAKFATMFDAILDAVKDEGVKLVKNSKAYGRTKELVRIHLKGVAPGIPLDSIEQIIKTLGEVA